MKRRSRTRWVLKWVGLGVCVLLLAAYVAGGGARGCGFAVSGRTLAVEVSVYFGRTHLTIAQSFDVLERSVSGAAEWCGRA